MKKLYLIILVCLLISCTNRSRQDIGSNSVSDSVSSATDQLPHTNGDEYGEDYEAYFRNYAYEDIKVFEPMAYNLSDYSKQLFNIMDTIVGLFCKNDRYYMKYCRITKTNVYEGDCKDVALIEPTLDVSGKCLFLFRGLKTINQKELQNLVIPNNRIWVGKHKDFCIGGISYRLSSEGDVVKVENKGTDRYYEDILNYRLYLSHEKKVQCLVKMKNFEDTMTEICFAGDLDGDNKPDFVIKSPSSKDKYRLLLFLSSYAGADELVKLVSITVDSFDC